MILQPDTKNRYYDLFVNKWQKIYTVFQGEDAIKDAGEIYLPKLTGQTPNEYKSYKDRGSFFNAFARTITGLSGAIVRKEPVITTAASINERLNNVTLYGESIQEIIKICINNVLQFAYYGILIDMPQDATEKSIPYFALYAPTSILNFRCQIVGADYKLTMISLLETYSEVDNANPFADITIERIRVLSIENGIVVVRLYRKDIASSGKDQGWIQDGVDIFPRIRGKALTEIPFVFFGATSNTPVPDNPPLLDLANLNIKHWQLTVDYYHGLHYCAIPTPWAAGFGKSDLYVGGSKAWVADNPEAKCGYLEFTGQGIEAIAKALESLESQMAVIGARMLEEQKKAAEAADTVRMRYSGDTATLSSVADCVEQGMMKAIDWLGKWMGIEGKTEITLNRDFVSVKLDAQMLTALTQSLQSGSMSMDTFLYNLQVGEILPSGRTIDDEKKLISETGLQIAPSGSSENFTGFNA